MKKIIQDCHDCSILGWPVTLRGPDDSPELDPQELANHERLFWDFRGTTEKLPLLLMDVSYNLTFYWKHFFPDGSWDVKCSCKDMYKSSRLFFFFSFFLHHLLLRKSNHFHIADTLVFVVAIVLLGPWIKANWKWSKGDGKSERRHYRNQQIKMDWNGWI